MASLPPSRPAASLRAVCSACVDANGTWARDSLSGAWRAEKEAFRFRCLHGSHAPGSRLSDLFLRSACCMFIHSWMYSWMYLEMWGRVMIWCHFGIVFIRMYGVRDW